MAEVKERSMDRIDVTCQEGLATYVAYDLAGKYGHYDLSIFYHDNTVEIVGGYIPAIVEGYLRRNDDVEDFKRYDVPLLEVVDEQ